MDLRKCLVILSLLISVNLSGQSKLKYDLITQEDGLSDNQIITIIQDKVGYLWIGTPSGLNRFDGHEFKTFKSNITNRNSLANDFINNLAIDKNNILWVGHLNDGITSFNQATGEFKRYPQIDGSVSALFIDEDNSLWIGLPTKGFCHFDPLTNKIEKYSLLPYINKKYPEQSRINYNSVNFFTKDRQGIFWLATNDGLYRFDPDKKILEPKRLVLDGPGTNRDDLISYLEYDDKNNSLYIAALNGIRSYNILNDKQEVFYYASNESNFYLSKITGIKRKSENELWINSTNKGVGIFNLVTKRFSFGLLEDSKIYPGILFLTEHFLWIGCGDGLIKVKLEQDPFEFHPLAVAKKKNSVFVTGIYFDSLLHKKFVAAEGGLGISTWDEQSLKILQCRNNSPNEGSIIGKVFNVDNDFLLVLSRDYIQLFDKKNEKWIEIDSGGTTNHMRAYFAYSIRDRYNNIWIGSLNDGIRVFNSKTRKLKWYTHKQDDVNSIKSNRIRGIVEDPWGRIWIATADCGIIIFDPLKKTFVNLNDLKYGVHIPFNDFESMAIAKDSTIWLGSIAHGLFKMKLKSEKSFFFNANNVSASVAIINVDKRGLIWVQAAGGVWTRGYGENIMVYDPKNDFSKYLFSTSNDRPYFNLSEVSGNVVIGSIDSYYINNGENLFSEAIKPETLVVNSIKVEGKEISFDPRGGSISLPYDRNSVQIQFSSLDFSNSPLKKYSFKLEGLENIWNKVSTNQRVATYSKLPIGKYIFKIKLINSEQGSSREKELIYLEIHPPFWKTAWFVVATYLTAIVLIYLIISLLIKRVTKDESIKQKLSNAQLLALRTQMNPHFIFNSLNAIQGLIIRADTVKATQFTARFSKLIRKVLENSEKQLISIAEEVETLQLYLSIESFRFDGQFKYQINVDEKILETEIPSMVIQPIIENVIWQNLSQTREIMEIVITFNKRQEKIFCTISHNGDGHSTTEGLTLPEKSVGLKLTASRLALISSRSTIEENNILNEDGKIIGHVVKIVFDLKSISTPKYTFMKEYSQI